MEQAEKVEINFGFRTIEVIEFSLNQPPQPGLKSDNFLFNIEVQQRIDAEHKVVHDIIKLKVSSSEVQEVLGQLSTLCVFHIDNFEEVVKYKDGVAVLPVEFTNQLNNIAISTTRGVMFTMFRGSYLHRAILPIVYPQQLQPEI